MITCLILLLLVVLFFLLLMTKIELSFGYREKSAFFHIKIGKLQLHPTSKQRKKTVKQQASSESSVQKILDVKTVYTKSKKHLKKALKRGANKITVKRLEFYYTGGFDDAAVTALSYGIVSGIVYDIYAMIQHFIGVEQTKINILPDFHQPILRINTEWQISFRVWHVFYVGCALLPLLFVRKK